MTKDHARKNRSRRARERTGASHASAAAGAAHQHPGPRIPPTDGTRYGVDRRADMTVMSRLVAAASAGCRPCQRTLTEQVLADDRLAIAGLAESLYGAMPAVGVLASPTTRAFQAVARESQASGDGRAVLGMVERLDALELEDLLEDTLDLWAGALSEPPPGAASAFSASGDQQAAPAAEADEDDVGSRRVAAASWSCGYVFSAGTDLYLTEQDQVALCKVGEASATGGEPIVCFLCDEPIDVTTESEVHVGLLPLQHDDGQAETIMPVLTHRGCGLARIWTPSELDAERARRGLSTGAFSPAGPGASTDGEDRADGGERAGGQEDFTMFSLVRLPAGIHPLLVIQPGRPHEHGLRAHLAELTSQGLRPVALDGSAAPEEVAGWQIRTERGRLTALTRSGAGAWYRQEGGYPLPGDWRKAARRRRAALVVVLPAGTLTDDGTDQRAALAAAARDGLALGGVMSIRGTLA